MQHIPRVNWIKKTWNTWYLSWNTCYLSSSKMRLISLRKSEEVIFFFTYFSHWFFFFYYLFLLSNRQRLTKLIIWFLRRWFLRLKQVGYGKNPSNKLKHSTFLIVECLNLFNKRGTICMSLIRGIKKKRKKKIQNSVYTTATRSAILLNLHFH